MYYLPNIFYKIYPIRGGYKGGAMGAETPPLSLRYLFKIFQNLNPMPTLLCA
jgi:hypothetical protein